MLIALTVISAGIALRPLPTSKLRPPLRRQPGSCRNCRAVAVPRLESPVGEWLVTPADCHGHRPHLHTHCHSLSSRQWLYQGEILCLKYTKNRLAAGLRLAPLGEALAPIWGLVNSYRGKGGGREGRGKGGEEEKGEGVLAIALLKTCRRPWLIRSALSFILEVNFSRRD